MNEHSRAHILALFAAVASLLTTRWGLARPDLKSWVDADTVSVGDTIEYGLEASSTGDTPSDPQPGNVGGFTIVRSSVFPSQMVTIFNGVRADKRGITATWSLRAQRVGAVKLGPASVIVGSQRVTAMPIVVNVVPPGKAPGRVRPHPFGGLLAPFPSMDPWQGIFGAPGDDKFQELGPSVQTDPKLTLDSPRASGAFLHAMVDKTSAVVGEQVTFSVYLYVDANEREPDFNDVHEAPANDFLKRPLLEDDGSSQPVAFAMVGGRIWSVKLIRKTALFPIKVGSLPVGSMRLAVLHGHVTGGADRTSEEIAIDASEPPLRGRPPGYVVGDVGHFSLAAQVTPRELSHDGALAVILDLSGTGNLPTSITPPLRPGLEWLPPETREKLGATADGKFGGTRTFSFVVRAHREGTLDLGDVTIPFWNPDAKAYAIARASLGTVATKPGALSLSNPDDSAVILSGLPEARPTLERSPQRTRYPTDSSAFWWSLLTIPLAPIMVAGIFFVTKRLRSLRAVRIASPEILFQKSMQAAAFAQKSSDPKQADTATSRALEALALARAGINVRALPKEEVPMTLEKGGIVPEVARDFAALLEECERARFSPVNSSPEDSRMRWKRARQLASELVAR